MIDHSLGRNYPETEVLKCVNIALLCIQQNPVDRPTMADVMVLLNSDATSSMPAPAPNMPIFSLDGSSGGNSETITQLSARLFLDTQQPDVEALQHLVDGRMVAQRWINQLYDISPGPVLPNLHQIELRVTIHLGRSSVIDASFEDTTVKSSVHPEGVGLGYRSGCRLFLDTQQPDVEALQHLVDGRMVAQRWINQLYDISPGPVLPNLHQIG
ncbi:hypothetical protein ABZP36_002172 [Zizania latifolia]